MNEAQALYQFLSGFGIPAYAFTSVPDMANLPYLTYEHHFGDLYSGDVLLEINLWYRTESEAILNQKAREIKQAVPCTLKYDNGTMWIKRGAPFSVPIQNEDNTIKCRRINLTIEYLSND